METAQFFGIKVVFLAHENWNTPSYSINITSTKEMIEWLIKIVGDGKITKEERREKTYYFKIDGNKKVRRFCDYIYKDATIFMERKYHRYKDLCKISGN